MFKNGNKGEGSNNRLLPPFIQYTEWLWLSFLSAILFVSKVYAPILGATLADLDYIPALLAGIAAFVGTVLALVASIPVSLIGIRHGINKALITVMFVTAVIFLLFDEEISASFILDVGVLGIFFGLFARKTKTAGEAIFGLIIVALISKLIFMGFMYHTKGQNPFLLDDRYIDDILTRSFNASGASMDTFQITKQYILLSFPTFLIAATGFEVFVNYLLISKIENRRQRIINARETETTELKIHTIPPFERWSFPRSLLAAFLLAFFIPLFINTDSSIMLLSTELNLKFLCCIMFFIQGLSLIWWWILLKNFSYGIRLSIFFVLFFVPILSMGFIIIGSFDIALDLRKRIRRNTK